MNKRNSESSVVFRVFALIFISVLLLNVLVAAEPDSTVLSTESGVTHVRSFATIASIHFLF